MSGNATRYPMRAAMMPRATTKKFPYFSGTGSLNKKTLRRTSRPITKRAETKTSASTVVCVICVTGVLISISAAYISHTLHFCFTANVAYDDELAMNLDCLYSSICVEGGKSEVPLIGILGSLHPA